MQSRGKAGQWFSFLLLAGILALFAFMAVNLVPLFRQIIQSRGNEAQMIDSISAYGARGALVLAGLQALQVATVFFPAAAIQLLAGLCYGIWLGSLISIVGSVLGNLLVFIVVRQFLQNVLPRLPHKKHTRKAPPKFLDVHRLRQMKNPEYMAFLLYLIPGIPGGVLPYIFAQTPISFPRYLVSITAASIPSILLYAWLGECIARRQYVLAAVLVAVGLLAVVLLLVFRRRLTALANKLAHHT